MPHLPRLVVWERKKLQHINKQTLRKFTYRFRYFTDKSDALCAALVYEVDMLFSKKNNYVHSAQFVVRNENIRKIPQSGVLHL